MSGVGKIIGISPGFAIAGGEVEIAVEGFRAEPGGDFGCVIGGERCRIAAASARRLLVNVPETSESGRVGVHLECGGSLSEAAEITIGKKLAGEMHIVANPAVDGRDESIILTRSGSRGQQIETTLFRLERGGFIDEIPARIMNPTGVAFDADGEMFVTNRAEGEVWRVGRDGDAELFADGLGVATGIAFDAKGVMYVGDRAGIIYKIPKPDRIEEFAILEPSVAAYHMAFGPEGLLFVTAPGLASHDAVYAIDSFGYVTKYFRGFGRPQGLAFDASGNLYVAACYRGRHGIVRVDRDSQEAELFVAVNGIVGLCFTRVGEMIAATNYEVYKLPTAIPGTLIG